MLGTVMDSAVYLALSVVLTRRKRVCNLRPRSIIRAIEPREEARAPPPIVRVNRCITSLGLL